MPDGVEHKNAAQMGGGGVRKYKEPEVQGR